MAGFHHVELWVSNFDEARSEWGWLLETLGFVLDAEWDGGQSWAGRITTPVGWRTLPGSKPRSSRARRDQVLLRTTSSVSSIVTRVTAAPSIRRTSTRAISAPISTIGWRTVVSAGSAETLK